jgi:hypothetical protein
LSGVEKGRAEEDDLHTHHRVKVYVKETRLPCVQSVGSLDVLLYQKAPYTVAVSGLLSFKDTEGTQSNCSITIAIIVHLAANMQPAQSFDAVI